MNEENDLLPTHVNVEILPYAFDYQRLLAIYVSYSLQALTAQVQLFADPHWLRQQTAKDLSLLHETIVDHVTRILSAWSNSDSEVSSGIDEIEQPAATTYPTTDKTTVVTDPE